MVAPTFSNILCLTDFAINQPWLSEVKAMHQPTTALSTIYFTAPSVFVELRAFQRNSFTLQSAALTTRLLNRLPTSSQDRRLSSDPNSAQITVACTMSETQKQGFNRTNTPSLIQTLVPFVDEAFETDSFSFFEDDEKDLDLDHDAERCYAAMPNLPWHTPK